MKALISVLLLASAPAFADSMNITDISGSTLLGATAVKVYPGIGVSPVPSSIQTLTIANAAASGGNTMSCGYKSTITLNGQGTFTIFPGATAFWSIGSAPRQAIWCIASGASTPFQVVVGN